MNDKTPIYLMSIVIIVALVAVVCIMTGSTGARNVNTYSGDSITGNIVGDIPATNHGGFGRFLLGIALIGGCVYLYRNVE